MVADDKDKRIAELEDELRRREEAYNALVRKWNKFVPNYNAVVAPRVLGRPLAASEAQQRQVGALRKAGKSLRAIASATGLGFTTVRTITGRANGIDRTTSKANELRPLQLNRAKMATYRARKRRRDALLLQGLGAD